MINLKKELQEIISLAKMTKKTAENIIDIYQEKLEELQPLQESTYYWCNKELLRYTGFGRLFTNPLKKENHRCCVPFTVDIIEANNKEILEVLSIHAIKKGFIKDSLIYDK